MIKELEAKYTIFASVADMLNLENLSNLIGKKVTQVTEIQVEDHSGVAGGEISYVDTSVGRYVLKRMSIETDYIMRSSRDNHCRSITLWQYGLLDELLPEIQHQTIACSKDGNGWAILMHDFSDALFSEKNPYDEQAIRILIDAMAQIHAKFWNDPRIRDPRQGICSVVELLDMSSRKSAQKFASYGTTSPIPTWILPGWAEMENLLDSATLEQVLYLDDNRQLLLDKLNTLPYTLLHGDYRKDNLACSRGQKPIVFDWQESTYTLMTADVAWFVREKKVEECMGRVQAVQFYRDRLETYLNLNFTDMDWQMMLDLGRCVDALRVISFASFFSTVTEDPIMIRFWREEVIRQGQFIVNALKWL